MSIAGRAPDQLILPISLDYIPELCAKEEAMAIALLNTTMQLDNHYPSHPLFKTQLLLEQKPLVVDEPLEALTVFTDASSRTGKAGYVWKQEGVWKHHVIISEGSAQVLELQAVIGALMRWNKQPLNLVVDSLYVVGVVKQIHRSLLKHVKNELLFAAFTHLWHVMQHRLHSVFVTHIKSHTSLPSGLVEGNARADELVSTFPVDSSSRTKLAEARKCHEFFHQSASALRSQF